MNVLVTGACGFLGHAVVERLLSHGETNIKCLVRPGSDLSSLEQLRESYPEAKLRYVFGNLTSVSDARQAVEGVATVYHLAAGMRGLPATIFANTVVASMRLLEALGDEGKRVLLVSSIGVYGTSPLKRGSVVGEDVELDRYPEKRNVYFHAKIWQERLFRERAEKGWIDLVVIRPGVLYGEGNPNRGFPSRLGLPIGKTLFVLGDEYPLPFSHVRNCAEAVVLAGQSETSSGETYNVVDDNAPTASEYLREYRRRVAKVRTIRFPLPMAMLLSRAVERYHAKTHGQIPAVLTPYETGAMCKRHLFDNRKIKALGWKQVVPTQRAMNETFTFLKKCLTSDLQ